MASIDMHDNKFIVQAAYQEAPTAKTIPGYKWDPAARAWTYPASLETYQKLSAAFLRLDAAPRVLGWMDAEAERLGRVAATRQVAWQDAEPIEPMPITVKPFQHQIAAYNMMYELLGLGEMDITPAGGCYLMDMGTGKTLTSIAVALRGWINGKVNKIMIIAPSSVVPVWKQEIFKYADEGCQAILLTGPIAKRKQVLIEEYGRVYHYPTFAVTNYEGMRDMVDEIIKWKPDLIIFDEAHKLKSPGSQQSKAAAKIAKVTPYRLALTGTPISNTPLDAFGIYRAVDPSIFGTVFYSFRNRFAVLGGFQQKEVVGYKNMDEYQQKLHSIAFRVTKAECLDLPEMLDTYQYCELEPAAARLYSDMKRDAVAELSSGEKVTAVNVLAKLLRLSQIAGGYLDGERVSTAKVDLLADLLMDSLRGFSKKVVIFHRFTAEGNDIDSLLTKALGDIDPISYHVRIDGSTPMAERGDLVERFQTDQDCRVFLGQIQTVGLGLTLTAADTAIFYSCDFSYSNLEQAMSRLHRSGQRNPVTNIFLVAAGTVDEKILQALQDKRDLAASIVDNWKEILK